MLLVHSLNLIDDLVIDKQIMINTTTDIDIIAKSYFVLRWENEKEFVKRLNN